MQNWISNYMVTYSTFRNNHICFNFRISFTVAEIGWHLQPSDTFPGLQIYQNRCTIKKNTQHHYFVLKTQYLTDLFRCRSLFLMCLKDFPQMSQMCCGWLWTRTCFVMSDLSQPLSRHQQQLYSQGQYLWQKSSNTNTSLYHYNVKLGRANYSFGVGFLCAPNNTAVIRDCNPGLEFSIPGFGIVEFPIPGSRRDWRSVVKTTKIATRLWYSSCYLNYNCVWWSC